MTTVLGIMCLGNESIYKFYYSLKKQQIIDLEKFMLSYTIYKTLFFRLAINESKRTVFT